MKTYDMLAIGRSSLDLYANDIGAPFAEIKSFERIRRRVSYQYQRRYTTPGAPSCTTHCCGGRPRSGEFLLKFLKDEGVETQFIPHKPGRRTSAVVLGIEPPDRFPLIYYRDNCADIALTIDDVLASPIADSRATLVSGTGLSREPSRSATLYAIEQAKASGTQVFLDLDFRADQWHDPRAFGVGIRSALRYVDIAIGTRGGKSKRLPSQTFHNSQLNTPKSQIPRLREIFRSLLRRF